MPDDPANAAAARPKRKRRRALKIALAAFVLLLVAVAALVGFALSERGLPLIVARIVAESGGRITVEEPTGSIAGEMRFRRIRWRTSDTTVRWRCVSAVSHLSWR